MHTRRAQQAACPPAPTCVAWQYGHGTWRGWSFDRRPMVGEGRGLPANAARLIDGRIRTAVERQIFRAAHHARPGTSVAHPRVVIMKLTSVVLVAFLGSAELACAAVSPEPDPYGDPGGMAGMDTGGAGATPSGGIGGSGASRLASGRGAAGSTPPPGATT